MSITKKIPNNPGIFFYTLYLKLNTFPISQFVIFSLQAQEIWAVL